MTTKQILPISISLLILLQLTACTSLEQKPTSSVSSAQTEVYKTSLAETTSIEEQSIPTSTSRANVKGIKSNFLDSNKYLSAENDPLANLWDIIPSRFKFSNINNSQIEKEKIQYLKSPENFKLISERAKPFLYFIVDEIKKRDLPYELALLPIVESAFESYAYSHGQAAGLWQFIPSTGKYFGLTQNWWYDGRRDIYASTHAALDYLEQLNKRFNNDWLLTLAAYNAGGGNVSKAIRKNTKLGKGTSFWDLKLPKETTRYVPRLIALAQIVKEKEQNQIVFHEIKNQALIARVNVESQIDLAIAAELAQISIEEIYQFNPGFNQWATNPQGPHKLLLPIKSLPQFKHNFANLPKTKRLTWARYKIKSGDNLSTIARSFNVSLSDIKKVNQLKNHKIRAGKYLTIPTASVNNATYNKDINKRRAKILSKIKTSTKKIHRVKPGESLWSIARKYRISHKKLAKLNRISGKKILSIGQKLVVWKKNQYSQSSYLKRNKKAKKKRLSYKVKSGDSLYVIAKRYKTTIKQLVKWNRLKKRKYLKIGQAITIFI